MASVFRKFWQGLGILGKATADLSSDTLGEIEVDSTTSRLIFHNGTARKNVVHPDSTDTLTNKTIDADGTGNSITNIENADIKAAAAIAATKIADGSVSNTEYQFLNGVADSIITRTSTDTGANRLQNKDLADSTTFIVDDGDTTKKVTFSVGGATTAKTLTLTSSHTDDRIITIPNATDTLIGKATTDALTNKDYQGGTASNSSRLTIPSDTYTNINALTRKEATILYSTDRDLLYVDDGAALNPVGGNWVVSSNENIGVGGTVTISLTNGLQYRIITGNGAAVTASTTPFGSSAPTAGVVIRLRGGSDTNTVTITNNNAAKGCIMNGNAILGLYDIIEFQYDSTADRWIEVSRNF